MRARLAQLRRTPELTQVVNPDGEVEPESPIRAALDLIKRQGLQSVPPPPVDHHLIIARLQERSRRLHAGEIAQRQVVDAIVAELSAEIAGAIKGKHRELLARQYRAAALLAAETENERTLRRSVVELGYTWLPDALPAPLYQSVAVLGAETYGELCRVRGQLEAMGIL
jgi:hypothetical protein